MLATHIEAAHAADREGSNNRVGYAAMLELEWQNQGAVLYTATMGPDNTWLVACGNAFDYTQVIEKTAALFMKAGSSCRKVAFAKVLFVGTTGKGAVLDLTTGVLYKGGGK